MTKYADTNGVIIFVEDNIMIHLTNFGQSTRLLKLAAEVQKEAEETIIPTVLEEESPETETYSVSYGTEQETPKNLNSQSMLQYLNINIINTAALYGVSTCLIKPAVEETAADYADNNTSAPAVADEETMTQTADLVHEEVVNGVLNLFPDNDELFVNNDYESVKNALGEYLDESPVAVNLYVKNETSALLTRAAEGNLTRDEYENSLRETLYATYPGINDLSESEQKTLKTKLGRLSADELTELQDAVLELPSKGSEGYDTALEEFQQLFNNKVSNKLFSIALMTCSTTSAPSGSTTASSAASGGTNVSFEEVFERSYGIEYDAEKMQAYQEAKNLYEVELSIEASRQNAHNALDNAVLEEDIEAGVLSTLYGMTTSTKDEDMTTLIRNMTGMSNVSIKDGKIVTDDMTAVKNNLLKTIDQRAEEFYAENSSVQTRSAAGSIQTATADFENSYKEAFGEKSLKQTNQAMENDNSQLVSNIRTAIEGIGLASGVGAMVTCNPILLGVSLGCSIMAPGVELIYELTKDNPSDEKIKQLLGEMGVNAALAGFGAAAGALGSIAGKAVTAVASKGKAVFSWLADKATDFATSVMGNLVLTGNADVTGEMINQSLGMALGFKAKNGLLKNWSEKLGLSAQEIKTDLFQAKAVLSDEEVKWAEKRFKDLSDPAMDVYGDVINRVMNGEIIDKKGLNKIINEACERHGVDDPDDLRDCLEELMGKTDMDGLFDCITNMTPSMRESMEDDYREYAQDCINTVNERLGITPPHNDTDTDADTAVDSDRGDAGSDGNGVSGTDQNNDVEAGNGKPADSESDNNGADNVSGSDDGVDNTKPAESEESDINDENKVDADNGAGEPEGAQKPENDSSLQEHYDDVMDKYKFADDDCVTFSDDILDSIKDKVGDGNYDLADIEKIMHEYLDDKSLLAADVRKMAQRIADELDLARNQEFMDDFNENLYNTTDYKDELHEMLDEALKNRIQNNRKDYEDNIKKEYGMRDYSSYELSENLIKDLQQKIDEDPDWATAENLQEYLYGAIDPNEVDYRDVEKITERVMNNLDLEARQNLEQDYLANRNSLLEPQNTTQKIIDRVMRETLGEGLEEEEEDDFSDVNNSSGNVDTPSGGAANDYGDVNNSAGNVNNNNDYGDINNSAGSSGNSDYNAGIPDYDYSEPEIPEDDMDPSEPENNTPPDDSNNNSFEPDDLPDTNIPDEGTPGAGQPDIEDGSGSGSYNFGDDAVVGDDGSVYIPNNDNESYWSQGNSDGDLGHTERDTLSDEDMEDRINELNDKYGDDYDISINEYGDAILTPRGDSEDYNQDFENDYGDVNVSSGNSDGYNDSGYDDDWYGNDWLEDWYDDYLNDDSGDWYADVWDSNDTEDTDWNDDWNWGSDDWNDYDRYLA